MDELTANTGGTPQQFLPFDENCKRIRQILQDAWTLPEQERRRIFRRLLFQWHPDKNHGSGEYALKMFIYIKQCLSKLEQCGQLCDEDEVGGQSNDFSRSSYSSIRDISEAQRWMRQAKHDFQAATTFLSDAGYQKAYNWICYMSHQASEKALKAACYAKNANAVSLQDHSLTQPASVLSPTLTALTGKNYTKVDFTTGLTNYIQQAVDMERHVGHHTRMLYPNAMDRPRIPADVFTEDDARVATDIARKIIENTSDLIV